MEQLDGDFTAFLNSGKTLTVGGLTLHTAEKETIELSLATSGGGGGSGVVIVPDKAAESGTVETETLNVNFKNPADAQSFDARAKEYYGEMGDKHDRPYDGLVTKQDITERAAGISTVVSYLILYIALVFLITSAAILAIQQLSESADNAARYGLLHKLGADEKMLNRALFTQIGLYFLLPLSLAVVHSFVGIRVVNRLVELNGHTDIAGSTLTASIIFVLVYGGYFLATYFASKSMLRAHAEN